MTIGSIKMNVIRIKFDNGGERIISVPIPILVKFIRSRRITANHRIRPIKPIDVWLAEYAMDQCKERANKIAMITTEGTGGNQDASTH